MLNQLRFSKQFILSRRKLCLMARDKIEWMKHFQEKLSDIQALDLLLVVTGSRPACLVMDPDEDTRVQLEKFCSQENFSQSTFTDRDSSRLGSQGMFISSDEKRFNILEGSKGRFYGLEDQDVGRFLGFPEEDVNYFHENIQKSPVEPEMREKLKEMEKNGKISREEAKLVEIVSYVPKPQEENIYAAIERGRDHFERIIEFDDEKNTDVGKNILEDFYGTVFESLRKELLN